MKQLLPTLLLVLFSTYVLAQNTLQGNVKGAEDDAPLIGATIYIPDLKKGATTNLEGAYFIDHLPNGRFLIEIRYVGYATVSEYITIDGETNIDFTLSASATEMENVIITGVSVATEASKSPVPTTFMNKEDLESSGASNIVDAITRKPGISQISTGPGISKPVIRGLGYNRVVTLNNNMKQEGQQWGDEHGIEIDQFSVNKVEVIKGPGSLMYGSDAMAGVINFLPPEPINDGEIRGSFMGSYQTNNLQQGYSLMNTGNLSGFNWRIRGSYKQAGNYRNEIDGRIHNTGFNELDVNGYVGLNKKWGYSHLNFSSFSQELGIAEGERDAQGRFIKLINAGGQIEEAPVTSEDLEGYHIGFPKQKINHYTLSSNNNFILGDSRLSVNLGFQRNIRKELSNPVNPDDTELHMKLDTYSYDLKYHIHDFGPWETTVGLSGQHQRNYNYGEEYLIPDYHMTEGGVFAVTQRSINALSINGGLRFDYRTISASSLFLDANDEPANEGAPGAEQKFGAFQKDYSNLVGSIGVSYAFTEKWLAKLNVSRGFRAPNIAELGSNGEHEGTFRYEVGNQDLASETSRQVDLGIAFAGDHLNMEVNGFYNGINNYIYLEKLSSTLGGDSISASNEPAPVYQYRQGTAYLFGGEFMLDIHPHPLDWLHFENSFAISIGHLKNQPDSMKYTPFQPAPKFRSEIRTDFRNKFNHVSKLSLSLYYEHYFEQNRIFSAYNTETATPAYGLLGAGVSASFVNGRKQPLASLHIIASNILDQSYQSHLNRLKYAPENPATGRMGLYNMGRNITVKLVVPLVFKQ